MEHLVEELTAIGFISLVLIALQGPFESICVSYSSSVLSSWTYLDNVQGCDCCLSHTAGVDRCFQQQRQCGPYYCNCDAQDPQCLVSALCAVPWTGGGPRRRSPQRTTPGWAPGGCTREVRAASTAQVDVPEGSLNAKLAKLSDRYNCTCPAEDLLNVLQTLGELPTTKCCSMLLAPAGRTPVPPACSAELPTAQGC